MNVCCKFNTESYLTDRKENINEWHRKLGHLGIRDIKKLINISADINLSNSDYEKLKFCDLYQKAKHTKSFRNNIYSKNVVQ